MRICIVTRTVMKGDGQGRVNYEVALEAARCGHQVTLLATNVAPELQQHPQIAWVNVPVKTIPTQLLSSLLFSWYSARWLHKHGSTFDIIQVNGANTSAPAHINAVHFVNSSWLRSPVHTARLRHDWYGFYQWLNSTCNANWEKQSFRRAKVIIAVSEKIKQELITIGIPSSRIHVILNGVDLDEFSPRTSDRKTLNFPENVPLALFAGDLKTPRKNLDTVLQALTQVPELHLVVAGSTERSAYPKMAEALGLTQRVHFLGYRQDIATLMQAVDLFVFPSRYEACTLVLLEAMASGLPVITATTVGGSELITSKSGIVLSDSDHVVALANALNELMHHSEKRRLMGETARAIALHYSWKRMAQSYIRLFEEVSKTLLPEEPIPIPAPLKHEVHNDS